MKNQPHREREMWRGGARPLTSLGLILLAVVVVVVMWSRGVGREAPVRALVSSREVHPVPRLLVEAVENAQALKVVYHGGSEVTSNSKTDKVTSQRDSSPLLLILVDSQPGSFSLRDAARRSWMQSRSVDQEIAVRFMVFARDTSMDVVERLREESAVWKDLVVFLNVDYSLDSERLLYELIWVDRSLRYQYLLKIEEHYYVRVRELFHEIENFPEGMNVFGGYFVRSKDSAKLSEPRWFLCDQLIQRPHSGGYILSQALVHRLVSHADYLELYSNEGTALSVWLIPFNDIEWKHQEHFDTEIGHARSFRKEFIVFATDNASAMLEAHELVEMIDTHVISHEDTLPAPGFFPPPT